MGELTMEIAVVLAVVLGIAAWQGLAAFFRPKYAVTVQKTTNVNDQPEVVTISANLGRKATPEDVWMEIERSALASTARMVSVNQDIIDDMAEHTQKIAARKGERDTLREELVTKRIKKKVAKLRGISPKDVTPEMLAEAHAKAERNGRSEPVS